MSLENTVGHKLYALWKVDQLKADRAELLLMLERLIPFVESGYSSAIKEAEALIARVKGTL